MVTYLPIALWLLLLAIMLVAAGLSAFRRDRDDLDGCPCEDCDVRIDLSESQIEFEWRQIVDAYDKEESL